VNGTRADELLDATRVFLREEVLPELAGFKAYATRVAANNLAIVARELELGPALRALDADMARRLGIELGERPLSSAVALALKSGALQPDPMLLQWLRQRTLLALAIDNPRYSGYRQARARWAQPEEGER
jgi:hypothetical protein